MSQISQSCGLFTTLPLNQKSVQALLPARQKNSYKGTYGKVLVVAGAPGMGGACILATSAAVYSGAGLVTAATAACHHNALHARLPEAMTVEWDHLLPGGSHDDLLSSVDTVLVGPGLGRSVSAEAILLHVLQSLRPDQTCILDASALGLWLDLGLPPINGHAVITPHPGEWAALSGCPINESCEVQIHQWLRKHLLNGSLVLKSHQTTVYRLNGDRPTAHQLCGGNPGMAIGGMGDSLAGLIAGLSKQTNTPEEAVLLAVWLHSAIGDSIAECEHIVLPHRLIERIPQSLWDLRQPKPES